MTYQRAAGSCSSATVKARNVCVDSTLGRGALGTPARCGGAAGFAARGAAGVAAGWAMDGAALAAATVGALADRLTATVGAAAARAAGDGGGDDMAAGGDIARGAVRRTISTESESTGIETAPAAGCGRVTGGRGAAASGAATCGAATGGIAAG